MAARLGRTIQRENQAVRQAIPHDVPRKALFPLLWKQVSRVPCDRCLVRWRSDIARHPGKAWCSWLETVDGGTWGWKGGACARGAARGWVPWLPGRIQAVPVARFGSLAFELSNLSWIFIQA